MIPKGYSGPRGNRFVKKTENLVSDSLYIGSLVLKNFLSDVVNYLYKESSEKDEY
jgi:hypothetical protein